MKNFKSIFLLTIVATFSSFTVEVQEISDKITATYEGYVADSYSFTFINEEEESETIIFDEVSEKVLVAFDLKSSDWLGKEFVVTFEELSDIEEDEEGEEIEVTKTTIVGLQLVE